MIALTGGQALVVAVIVALIALALFVNTMTDLREREERQRHRALLDELRRIECIADHPTSRRGHQ